MDSDLIRKVDAQKILKALYDNRQYSDISIALLSAMEDIHDLPTVDAKPVVHGRWRAVKIGVGASSISFAKCSACGRKMNISYFGSLYCGLCGAKMDGGDK